MDNQAVTNGLPLADQHFQERLRDYVNWLIIQDDIQTAYDVLKKVQSAVEQDKFLDQLTKNNYHRIIWLLQGECLPFLSNEDVLEFFRQGLSVVLENNDLDLLDKLEAKLLRILIHEERDSFKNSLKEILSNNPSIFVESHSANSSLRTVADWIKDYISVVGVEVSDSFKRGQYISQRESLKKLDPSVKDRIRKLLVLFDYLGHSSLTPEGLEEKGSFIEDGRRLVLDKGQVREIQETDAGPIISKLLSAKKFEEQPEKVNVPKVMKSSAPAFLFDEEDEKEADRYREQVADNQEQIAKPLEERLREYAKEVIATNNLSFKDEINARRFELLFVSRLKEVRSQIEVKESLMKQVANGGLGLSEVVAEKVAGIIEKAKKNYESRIRNQEFKDSSVVAVVPSVRKAVSDGKKELDKLIAAELPVVLPKKPIALPPVGRTKETVKPVSKFAAEVKLSKEVVKEKKVETEMDKQKVLQALAKAAVKSVPVQTKSTLSSNLEVKPKEVAWPAKSKPQLSDVKAPSKTLGPLDELRVLSLTDFRRLSPKATEALHKIQSKIELIGETSIAQKIEAIRSWQASAVYQNYLSLGRLSIQEGKPVSQIIIEKTQAGEPCLTEEEFQAIVDLNEKLRF